MGDSFEELRDRVRAAGGDAWDNVSDVQAELNEIRWKLHPQQCEIECEQLRQANTKLLDLLSDWLCSVNPDADQDQRLGWLYAQVSPATFEETKAILSEWVRSLERDRSMSEFAFQLNQSVRLTLSGETGKVVGRAQYTNCQNTYRVRYKSADGRQVEVWHDEDAMEAVPNQE